MRRWKGRFERAAGGKAATRRGLLG